MDGPDRRESLHRRAARMPHVIVARFRHHSFFAACGANDCPSTFTVPIHCSPDSLKQDRLRR